MLLGFFANSGYSFLPNYFGGIYQIQHHIWSITRHTTQYEVQSPQQNNPPFFFADQNILLLNHTLIRVVSSLSQCLRLVVHILYLYLAQEYQTALTLLLSEACPFVIRMGGSFDFLVGKRLTSHLFGFDMRWVISKIVVSHPLNCQANS